MVDHVKIEQGVYNEVNKQKIGLENKRNEGISRYMMTLISK